MFWGHLLKLHRNRLCLVLADCYLWLLLHVSRCRHVSPELCVASLFLEDVNLTSLPVCFHEPLSQREALHLTTRLQARKVVGYKHQHGRAKKRKREDKMGGVERRAVNYRNQKGEEERTEKRSVFFFLTCQTL